MSIMRLLMQIRNVVHHQELLLQKFSPSKYNLCQLRQSARCYCEKIDRPSAMNQNKASKIDFKKKAVGPISWFNLGVSGILVGVMMGFYYYARYKIYDDYQ